MRLDHLLSMEIRAKALGLALYSKKLKISISRKGESLWHGETQSVVNEKMLPITFELSRLTAGPLAQLVRARL